MGSAVGALAEVRALHIEAGDLARTYAQVSDEELTELHESGTLTAVAYEVLEAEMRNRQLTVPSRPTAEEMLAVAARSARAQSLGGHWRGEARLASAFWLLGIAGGFAIGLAVRLAETLAPRDEMLRTSAGLVLLAYSVFTWVSVWRCAKNTSWIGWAYLARGCVVLSCLAVVFSVVLALAA